MQTSQKTQQRFSRYHCSSNPPPALDVVVRELAKRNSAKNGIKNKQAVRALAQQSHSHYHDKGKSDDLCRFLLNVGVLLESSEQGRLYFDAVRAAVVLECCRNGQEPDEAPNPEARIRELSNENDAAQHEEEATISAAPSTQASVAPASPAEPVQQKTHAIFLTPIEHDVWISICTMVTDDEGTFSLRAPNEPEALHREWASQELGCSAEEYDRVFRSFVERGLLEEHHPDDEEDEEDNDLYLLTRDPTTIHVVEIPERPAKIITRLDMDIVHKLELGFRFEPGAPLAKIFADAVTDLVPSDKVNAAYTKFVGGPNTLDHKYSYWGIIYRQPVDDGGTETYVCLAGFERFAFELKGAQGETGPTSAAEGDTASQDESAEAGFAASATMPSPGPASWDDEGAPPSERRVVITPPPDKTPPALGAAPVASATSEDEQRRRRIEAMDDAELERKLEEWRRMLEILPISIRMAEAEQARRDRANERKRLAAQLEAIRAEQERLQKAAQDKAEEAERLAAEIAALQDP